MRVFLGAVIHHSLVNLLWDKDPARRIFAVSNEEAARQFAEILLRGVVADPPGGGETVSAPRAAATRPTTLRFRGKNKKR